MLSVKGYKNNLLTICLSQRVSKILINIDFLLSSNKRTMAMNLPD